jgi:hypothetical protein
MDIMERAFMILLELIGIFLVLLFFLGIWAGITDARNASIAAEQCNRSGGVYIKHMTKVGKGSYEQYMCMKKDLFIELERN